MSNGVALIPGRNYIPPSRNYIRYPQLVAVQASNITPRLLQFVDAKIHEYMVIDSSFIYGDGAIKVTPDTLGYLCNLDTFLLSELREAIVNNICYNVIIRLKNKEIGTLIQSTQNIDIFLSVFMVGYSVDHNKLKDILLNNDNSTSFDYADCSPDTIWTNKELMMDYIDNFNTRVLREIYNLLKHIVKTSSSTLVAYIVELTDQLYDQIIKLFREQQINLNIRPISVFVSPVSYDLILLN